jgi:hypothetical protein
LDKFRFICIVRTAGKYTSGEASGEEKVSGQASRFEETGWEIPGPFR